VTEGHGTLLKMPSRSTNVSLKIGLPELGILQRMIFCCNWQLGWNIKFLMDEHLIRIRAGGMDGLVAMSIYNNEGA
jgi:hypothetical protein